MGFTNINAFLTNVKKQIAQKVQEKEKDFEIKSSELVKNAIADVDAVDTGLMQSKSFTNCITNINSNDVATVNFKTENSEYAIFVHEGLGVNRKYGRRSYLEIARKQFLEVLTTNSYNKVKMAGSPNKQSKK